MKKSYYLCSLEGHLRISKRCASSSEAAIDCFGITRNVATVPFNRKWCYLSNAEKEKLEQTLEQKVKLGVQLGCIDGQT